MSETHIKLVDICKRFKENIAVDHLSLDVEKGNLLTILGPSGCGKTTTLRILAGFEDPDEGKIMINDQLINEVPPHRRRMGMVFQSYALFPHMNVFNNIAYGLILRKEKKSRIKDRVTEVINLVGLEGMERRATNQLSGGQQQRVALARTIAIEPEALLMDEPLSNLDASLRSIIRIQIRTLQQHLGITTIYVTHDQEEAFSLSDKIAIMKGGRLQQVDTPWEMYHNPKNQFVAKFIGVINFLEAKIETVIKDDIILNTSVGRLTMFRKKGLEFLPGKNILVTIKSEGIRIKKRIKVSSSDNVLEGKVKQHNYTGKMVKYWVDVGGGITISVESFNPEEILVGKVNIAFDKFCIYPIFNKMK
jgi:iron(III) transport system ATP-binding protein